MASTPAFTATPRISSARISTANTNLDGTGTVAALFAAGASGSIIERIFAKAGATTTAGMLRFFIHNGSAYRLWKEIAVSAITPAANTKSWENSETVDLKLPAGHTLYVATEKAESFDVIAEGGDF